MNKIVNQELRKHDKQIEVNKEKNALNVATSAARGNVDM